MGIIQFPSCLGALWLPVFCQSQPWIRERTGHQFRAVGGLNQENPMIVQ